MALLNIGGVDMPTPTEMDISVMDLSKAERNSNGTMLIERIATKKKLGIKYSFLTANQLSTVLKAISPTFYTVTYLDPVTNIFTTSTFYVGDRSLGVVDFQNGVARYQDVSFDLIER